MAEPKATIRRGSDGSIVIDLPDDAKAILQEIADDRGISLEELVAEGLRLERLLAQGNLFERGGEVRVVLAYQCVSCNHVEAPAGQAYQCDACKGFDLHVFQASDISDRVDEALGVDRFYVTPAGEAAIVGP